MKAKVKTKVEREDLRACAYCSGYTRLDPCIIIIDEAREEAEFKYNCGDCGNMNKITFTLRMVEVFDQKGMPVKDPELVTDYLVLVNPEEFRFCPTCGYSCDWGASEETKDKFIYHCPNCNGKWEFTR